ncbi:MAG: DUF4115 domain-containing protein [Rhodospirillaceae bacterium]|nr:DUF4115 domain-containing protein [Rhodospirillales bacterium]
MRTLAIFCGASLFPRHPALNSNVAFAASAMRARDLIQKTVDIIAEDVLYLVDSEADVLQQIEEITEFLEQRSEAERAIFYYVGHGIFGGDRDYYLTLRRTRERQELFTSIRVKSLAHVFENFFGGKQLIIVLDCCFSGEAAASFMSPITDVIKSKVYSAFPEAGTALLVAASKDEPALALLGADLTMFTEGLVQILETGVSWAGDRLSLAQLGRAIREYIKAKHGYRAVLPQVHSPRQIGVDVASLPIFANSAFVANPAAEAEADAVQSRQAKQADIETPPLFHLSKENRTKAIAVGIGIGIILAALSLFIPKISTSNNPTEQQSNTINPTKITLVFDTYGVAIPKAIEQDLDNLAKRLEGNKALRLEVRGYADGDPADASKARRLSLIRSLEVRNYLMDRGVHSSRIEVHAFGDKREGAGPADRVDLLLLSENAPTSSPPKPTLPTPPAALPSLTPEALVDSNPQTKKPSDASADTPLTIIFSTHSARMPDAIGPNLDKLAKRLEGNETLQLELRGYADGDEAHASEARLLSLSRTMEVREYLIDRGVRSARIKVHAFGNKREGAGPTDRVDVLLLTEDTPTSLPSKPSLPTPPAASPTPFEGGKTIGEESPDSRIRLRCLDNCWIQVRERDGQIIISRLLRRGDVYIVPNRQGLALMVGDAGALEVWVDGKQAPKLGDINQVRRGIQLNPEELMAAR